MIGGFPDACLNLPPNNIGRCSFLINLNDINGEERFDMKFIASNILTMCRCMKVWFSKWYRYWFSELSGERMNFLLFPILKNKNLWWGVDQRVPKFSYKLGISPGYLKYSIMIIGNNNIFYTWNLLRSYVPTAYVRWWICKLIWL